LQLQLKKARAQLEPGEPGRISTRVNRQVWTVVALALLCWGSFAPSLAAQDTHEEQQGPRLPDPVYILERVELVGEFSTSKDLIHETLALELGQEVNVSILTQAQLRLLATGFFRTAQFGLEPGSERGNVIVRVVLEERNTILLSDLFLGTSQRSDFWGGLDVLDSNIFGIGHTARAAFVTSGDEFAFEVSYVDPTIFASPVSMGFTAHFSRGGEQAFPVVAADLNTPSSFEVDVLRAGGRLSNGLFILPQLGLFLDLRVEGLKSDSPFDDLLESQLQPGTSWLSTAALAVELDTRDDPVMPRNGVRLNLSAEGAHPSVVGDYQYLRLLGQLNFATEFLPGHILRLDLVGGTIIGEAPFFERFFVGDFNDLLPSRNLGLNFASRPAADFFNTGTDQLGYENNILRASAEYAIPLTEGIDWVYRSEFFLGGGLYAATTSDADAARVILGVEPMPGPRDPFPFDLTINLGLRVETSIGIFGLSFANGLALVPL